MASAGPAIRKELHYGGRVVSCFADRLPTVDAVFRRAVAAQPDRLALVDDDARLTYRELDRQVDCVAGNLARRGLAKGERLALLIGNRNAFLLSVLACARIGVIVVPMGTRQKRAEVEFVLAQCGASGIVYDAEYAAAVPPRAAVPSLQHVIVIGSGDSVPFSDLLADARPPQVAIAEEDIFCLLYTSGTTGRPKGACLTHLGTLHSLLNYRYGMDLRDGEVSVLAVPASHVTGLVAILLAMIEVAGTTIMLSAFKAGRLLERAAETRMTHALMVPAMYNLCLLDPAFRTLDLSSWRIGGFGGAPMPEATIARLAEVVPKLTLLNVYGSTETTSPVTMMPAGAIAQHRDTVGRVLPCADILVMDDEGRQVAPGVAGELWIAGPMVIPGYWSNPDADKASFTHGYWRSGDVGSIDAEGFVRILDRKKDVINRGGYKIYSIEVENVLAQHPDVLETAVVPRPDPVLGQLVHAVVVPKRAGLTEAGLKAHCAEVLSDYKVPTSFTLLDTPLPRNANGKVLKTDLG
jgi:acyl-CoA synthetase (AMP-forming)/AMP-acid ligase II